MSPFTPPGSGSLHLDTLMLALARVQATPPVALESLYAQFAAPQLGRGDALTLVHVTALMHSTAHDWMAAQHQRGLASCRVYAGEPTSGEDLRSQLGVPCFDYSHLFTHVSREQAREATVMHA